MGFTNYVVIYTLPLYLAPRGLAGAQACRHKPVFPVGARCCAPCKSRLVSERWPPQSSASPVLVRKGGNGRESSHTCVVCHATLTLLSLGRSYGTSFSRLTRTIRPLNPSCRRVSAQATVAGPGNQKKMNFITEVEHPAIMSRDLSLHMLINIIEALQCIVIHKQHAGRHDTHGMYHMTIGDWNAECTYPRSLQKIRRLTFLTYLLQARQRFSCLPLC